MSEPFVIKPGWNKDNTFSHGWLTTDNQERERFLADQGIGQMIPVGDGVTQYSYVFDPATAPQHAQALDDFYTSEQKRLADMYKANPQAFNSANAKDALETIDNARKYVRAQIERYNTQQQQKAKELNTVLGEGTATPQVVQAPTSTPGVAQGGAPSTPPTTTTPSSTVEVKNTTTTPQPAQVPASTPVSAPQGYSEMTPIQFAQFAPEQVMGEPVYDPRLAYQNGQTTRKYTFDNGNPVNFTNNPHFNVGADPNMSSWSGLNMDGNQPLNMFQQMTLARIMGKGLQDMNAMGAARAQHQVQDAVNDPRTWQATQQLLEQGVPLEEAQYAAMSQLLANQGRYGAMNMVLPQYAQQAGQRQGNQGAMAGLFGMDYEAQPNLFGITNPITSIQTNGNVTGIQLGNARFNIPNEQVPQFMEQIGSLPNGPQLLSAMRKGGNNLTYQERMALAQFNAQEAMNRIDRRGEIQSNLQEDRQKFKTEQGAAKNSNVVGSQSF